MTHKARMTDDDRRQMAWMYLRRVIEGSRADVLGLLWDEDEWHNQVGHKPADVERLARAIYRRDDHLPPALLDATSHRASYDPRTDWQQARNEGMRLITPDDQDWPRQFVNAFAAMGDSGADSDAGVRGQAELPFALWVRGEANLARLVEQSVTVVGTRAATRYGRTITHQLCSEIAGEGYTIVSGGAEGIDKVAHRTALDVGAPTVVFLACGPDVAYPKKNQDMFAEVVRAGGLLVSEYAPGTPPARHRFLTRNRLAAAVSRGTLMVEAPYRSGAINTMNWAEAMNKPTMAVPGPVDVASSQGGLVRIQQGRAQLVRNAQDVFEQIEPIGAQVELSLDPAGAPNAGADGDEGSGPQLSWQETAVFDAAGVAHDDTGRLAQIQADTGLASQLIIRIVRSLEEKELLRREGDRWLKVPGAVPRAL